MLATVMMGSAEEGRKRIIGLVFAEEKYARSCAHADLRGRSNSNMLGT